MLTFYRSSPVVRWFVGFLFSAGLFWYLSLPAQAVPKCGGQTAQSSCGRSNFCICCDGTCANCVWWAWEAACRNWGFAFATCNDAHRWNEQAKGRGEPTGSTPRNGCVFVCEAGASCSQWGHVGWVVTANSNGSFSSTEQSCGGACTTSSRTRPAGFATGGFIYNPKGGGPPAPQCTSDAQCKDPSKPKCSNNICVGVSSPPSTSCTHVKVARTGGLGLRIRSSSNTQSNQLGTVGDGTCLQVIAKTTGENIEGESTWYKISHGGVTGWVSGKYADCSSCGGPPPECNDGQSRSCYTGPANTEGKGICKAGKQSCSGGKWGGCEGEVKPSAEVCDNKKDDNCNGQVDEDCTPVSDCEDKDGDGHKSGTTCTGTLDCDDTNKDIYPGAPEICGNQKDDNCDGRIDEDCPTTSCQDGDQQPCYSGPTGTQDVGACRLGKRTCQQNIWGACEGEVTPVDEICGNQIDDNCDGTIDEGCSQNPLPDTDTGHVPPLPDSSANTNNNTSTPGTNASNQTIPLVGCTTDSSCGPGKHCVNGFCRQISVNACLCNTSPDAPIPTETLWLWLLALLWLRFHFKQTKATP